MRKQIIALAAASILVPTIALAADSDTTTATATTTEQAVYVSRNDHDRDGDHDRKRHNRKGSQINYTGPVDLTPLADLKNTSWGDRDVIVEGRLIRQQADGNFILSDGKDEIVLDMEDIKLSDAINENTTLRIFGEYEGWDKKLEADYIQVIK